MDWMTPDLMWLIGGAIAAGLVRGFAGFGTAMIFLPVVGQVLDPFAAVTVLLIMDLVGPLPAIPRALRDGHPADVTRLVSAMVLTVPIGVMILAYISPESFRYLVALISLTLLICLISGLRYRGTLMKPMIYGTGAASGLLAGSAGIPGPPVILLYMASPHPASVVRANNTVFLLLSDVVILFVLALFGHLVLSAVGTGVFLIVPYLLANLVGAAIFRPELEKAYRVVAYLIIAASALSSLPFFD